MKRARRAVALILMLCMLLGMSAYAENESSCDIVEDWDASTDLMDADKYQSTNCTLTLGSDAEVGGYVAMKASNYGPLLTVTAQLAAGKSVGVWVKQANTLEGSVKLLQEGSEVASAGYTPVKDQWQMVILDVETDADAIRFVPNAYGNPSIGSIYYGTRDALEALAAAKPEPEPDDAVVVEAWGAGTDLTDATKYQANGCTFVGVTSDGAVGGCVEAKPNSYSPSVTVYGDFTAGAYVGVWVKESSVNGGAVKLLSGGSEVAVQQFSSEKDQWTFVMAEIPADSAVDGVNIAPSTTSAFFIGAIYCGSRTALEAIASGGGAGEGDTSDEDCPDQSAPGTPGGAGRWVLVDNFETGRISAYYSEADGVKIVSGEGAMGNYSACHAKSDADATEYLTYDKDLDASAYTRPAVAFWAKGEGSVGLWFGSTPHKFKDMRSDWTYYVFDVSSYTGRNGDVLDFITFSCNSSTEFYVDEIFFGEYEDLLLAPDDQHDVVLSGGELPEYVGSKVPAVHFTEDFESGHLSAEYGREQTGDVTISLYDGNRAQEDYAYTNSKMLGSYALRFGGSEKAGAVGSATLTMPAVGEGSVISFAFLTEFDRDESVNHWQISPAQRQDLTLQVKSGGEWTGIWKLTEDMGDDLYNGVWYYVNVPVAEGVAGLEYRFVYESDGGNALLLDEIAVEDKASAPVVSGETTLYGYSAYEYGPGAEYGFVSVPVTDVKEITRYEDADAAYGSLAFDAVEYAGGAVYAAVKGTHALVELAGDTLKVQRVVSGKIGSMTADSNCTVYGMTYDGLNDVLYVLESVDLYGGLGLYSVNLDTGSSTLIKQWNNEPNLGNLVCDSYGNLFGLGSTSLYYIDVEEAIITKICDLDICISGPWTYGATIDKRTNTLYYAPFSGSFSYGYSHIYAVDLTSFQVTRLGTVGNTMELTSLFVPFDDYGDENRVTITAGTEGNGRISPAGEVKVVTGKNKTFYFYPDKGYALSGLTVDGQAVDLERDPNFSAETCSYTFTAVTQGHTITAEFEKAMFTVTFKSWDGTVLKTQTVGYGENAEPPEAPQRTGYTFLRWDPSYTDVRNNIVVSAIYTINTYQVIFKDWNGKVLDVQRVRYGKAAESPAIPTREGYRFDRWDTDFGQVTSDLVVTALYVEDPDATGGGADVMLGDITGDGRVNAADAMALLRFLKGGTELPGCVYELETADADRDGQLGLGDVVEILKIASQLA